ncbi:Tetratricopeptide repeat-containing protein [Deinococcus hopiensis KR-140]|uniref:Tetratricopeptide repeat-containing protein n=2 Tax=Deinococcus TaxID=1298 RepID=A0A1W1UB31_9DEIO|nr:Tetratricopeptide repeat-containing protein [Deinococcus hopiensis KR-140]
MGAGHLWDPEGRAVRCDGKGLLLLTYLALEGATPRSRLADLFWPDRAEHVARNNLVQLLRRMRAAYGAELVIGHEKLTLAGALSTDVQVLLDGSADSIAKAELLQGLTVEDSEDLADWLNVQRERLDHRRAQLLTRRAEALEAQGDYGTALALAQRTLTLDPLSEDAHRRVMRLHYLSADAAQALRVYARLQAALRETLSTTPMPETQALARLIERGERLPTVPAPAPRLQLPPPPVLVGRGREWATLEGAWQAGKFIIIAGEPGVGKSRLAEDFARSKGRVLSLGGRPGDHLAPYTVAARNLRRVLNGAQAPLPDWARRSLSWLLPEVALPGEPPLDSADARLHEAIQYAFSTGLSEVDVCLFDDLQYVDEATIEAAFILIDAMFPLGRPGGLPHFVAVHRRDELPAFTRAVHERLVKAGQAVWVDVTPLPEGAVHAMITSMLPAQDAPRAADLARSTGGNPLFAVESVKAFFEAQGAQEPAPKLPEKVGEVISWRLARLPKMTLQVARAAAVLQREFSPELVAQVLSAPLLDVAAAWEDLEAAQILRDDRFVHDLVYEAVLAQLPAAVRRLLHRGSARALTEAGAAPARIAQQWLDGGQAREALPWLLRAADSARAGLRLREAAELIDRAARLRQAGGDAAGAFALWVQRAQTLAPSDDREARQHAVNTLLEQAATPHERARAWQLQAELFAACHEGVRAEVAVRRGLEALADDEAPALRASLLSDLGAALWTQGRVTQAVTVLEDARARLEPLGVTPELAGVLSSLAVVLDHQDRHAEADAQHQRACALLEAQGDTGNLLVALRNHSVCLCDLGRVREGLTLLQRALALEEGSAAGLWNTAIGHALVAQAHADLSEYDLALQHYARAQTAPEDLSGWLRAYYRAGEAEVWLALGEAARAEQDLQAVADAPGLPDAYRVRVLVALGRAAHALGRDTSVPFARAEALLDGADRPLSRVRLLLARAATSAPDAALPLTDAARALARAHELPGYELSADLRAALAFGGLGRADDAMRCSKRAEARLAAVEPADMTRGEALFALHVARHAAGHPDADAYLQAAADWVRHTAERHVPVPARPPFLTRHPVNTAILAARTPPEAHDAFATVRHA